jgi:apolipoprotein N-acyltransferase
VGLSGAGLAFAFPEPGLAPLAWVVLAPLLVVAGKESSVRRALGLGLACGIGFFGVLLIWIHLIGWVAWVLLVLLQAAFVALFAAVWTVVARAPSAWVRVTLAATTWVAVDFGRARVPLGGFTWGQLAQSQVALPWMLRPAAWGGGWLVSFVVVAVNALVAEAWVARRRGRAGSWTNLDPLGRADPWSGVRSWGRSRPMRMRASHGPVLFVTAAVVLLAAPLLIPQSPPDGPVLRVSMIQGDVAGELEQDSAVRQRAILDSHERLTKSVAGQHPDLVVWPESAVGLDPRHDPHTRAGLKAAAEGVGAPMIVGANLDGGSRRYRVTALEVSPRGRLVDRYQKTHLVPFGEYVPARDLIGGLAILQQIPTDAVAGDAPGVFSVAGADVGVVISFEGDFGSIARRPIALGARLLIVATNTSTWGRSWASAQHLAFSRLRAAENGVWVAHAAISGISAFVGPQGEVKMATDLYEATAVTSDVRLSTGPTFYARVGDWFPLVCIALSGAGVIIQAARRRDPLR